MTAVHPFQLTDAELHVFEHAIRHDKRPEVRQRATALRLLHLGHTPTTIAMMHAVTIARSMHG